MNWLPITEADLLAYKMSPLMTALRNAALKSGQTDPVVAITTGVITRIRTKVASCQTNRVDADTTTIPASLLPLACRMIVREAKGRLEMELTEDERLKQSIDERDLTAVASCSLVVEQPDDSATPEVQATQPSPTISYRRRRFGSAYEDGA